MRAEVQRIAKEASVALVWVGILLKEYGNHEQTPVHSAGLQTDIRIGHLTKERTVLELEDRKDTKVLVVEVAFKGTGRGIF